MRRRKQFAKRFGTAPTIVILGPVCNTHWMVGRRDESGGSYSTNVGQRSYYPGTLRVTSREDHPYPPYRSLLALIDRARDLISYKSSADILLALLLV